MILFVSNTCPRCIPLKNMVKNLLNINVINITTNPENIELFGLHTVPVLRIDDKNITDIQEIIKIIKKLEGEI